MTKPILTQEFVKRILDYNPDTGLFTWKERDSTISSSPRGIKTFNKRFAGKQAGCVFRDAYITIVICSVDYLAHRIAWLYMTGEWPDQTDHENHNGLDNRFVNLRSVTNRINHLNRTKNQNNTSGVCGVYWRKDSKKWRAMIFCEGKFKQLGNHINFHDAVAARARAEIEFGFHPNHGKTI